MAHRNSVFEDYRLFQDFFDSFSNSGFTTFDSPDPVVVELDEMMQTNNQLFYLSDAILLNILYITKSVTTIFGIAPEKVSQGFFLTTTHPDDFKRHHLARIKLIGIAQELFIQKMGSRIICMNLRAKNAEGTYFHAFYQAKLFYSTVPYESVFLKLVITDITKLDYFNNKVFFYNGEDHRFFSYPDHPLFTANSVFTKTELKIIELVEKGLSTKEIAETLFRSIFTINTHRTNIIRKAGKPSMQSVIADLKDQGML